MRGYRGRAAATGAAVFVLTGSAMLGGAGTAAAETKTAPCGGTVTAAPGDRIIGVNPLGLRLDLGIVTEGVGSLLGNLCKVTVDIVDTVESATAPVPGSKQVGDAVGGLVGGTTKAAGQVVDRAGEALSGSGGNEPAPAAPPADPAPESPPAGRSGSGDPAPAGTNGGEPRTMPAPNSPVLGGAALPGAAWLGYTTGWAPMRDYTGIPMATPGLFSVSPGVRYGGQIPGYSPEFGILGQSQDGGTGSDNGAPGLRNAGSADALPADAGDRPGGTTLPMLLAVLALSGVTAALVRTWVLRATS